MEYSLTDRPSLESVDFNIDLTFFIRSRLKHGFSLDFGLTGEKSTSCWACKMGETGRQRLQPPGLVVAKSGEIRRRCAESEARGTVCDLTV